MTIGWLHFLRPYWLLALLPALALLAIWHRRRSEQGSWSALCDDALLPFLLQRQPSPAQRWPALLAAIATALAIIALAGPSWQRLPAPVFRNAAGLVIALDLSPSMNAGDIKPSRLARARYKIADLLKQRKDGQTALLVFAGEAYTVTPLTNDNETIGNQLAALTTDIMPNPGDNAAAALTKAAALLQQAGLPQGQIVLVSDGVAMADAKAVLPSLAGRYRVSVLAVGTAEGGPIAAPGGGFVKDANGNIVIPKLDGDGLAELARQGGGIYQPITAGDEDIQKLVAATAQASQQQGQEGENAVLELWQDQGPWLLLAVLPLAALAFRKGVLGCLLLLPALAVPEPGYAFDWQELWLNDQQLAQQAYQQHDYAKSAEKFKELLRNNPSSDGYYNEGNALAKAERLQEAIKAYEKALEVNPDNADAKFNKDLLEQALKKQQQQQTNQGQQQNQANNSEQTSQNLSQAASQNSNQNSSEQPGAEQQQSPGRQPEQADNGRQPKQQPEHSEQTGKAEQQQARQASAEQQRQDGAESGQEQAAQGNGQQLQHARRQAAAEAENTDEQQQANEQWLNRIPDDPSGLLKRKFKYQYGRQNR